MSFPSRELINTTEIELWPGGLLRARSNADARLLARAERVLRRKRDGRYLGVWRDGRLIRLPACRHDEAGLTDALAALRGDGGGSSQHHVAREHAHIAAMLAALDIPTDYGLSRGLPQMAEPARLHWAGVDRYRRPLWLASGAAQAWAQLRQAAQKDAIVLDAISGYRSRWYQFGIIERKRARGLSMDTILGVNAAPGYSEHHSGRALDLSTPGEPAAEESFEHTPAFAWLTQWANTFGFSLSYPRNNPHGVVYEPWHWCWQPPGSPMHV